MQTPPAVSAVFELKRDKFTKTTESCGGKGTAWPLSQGESCMLILALRGFYCFSGHIFEDGPHLLHTGSLWVVTFYRKQRRGCC